MRSEPEIWLPVPGIDFLEASSWGRVRAPGYFNKAEGQGRKWCVMAPTFGVPDNTSQNRLIYCFRRKMIRVHAAVCAAFHGPKPFPEAVAMHLDEDNQNNVPSNLRWGTQKENLNMPGFLAYCKGRIGEANPHVKGKARKTAP